MDNLKQNLLFESKEIENKTINLKDEGKRKEIENKIQSDEYALYHSLSALAHYKKIEMQFFKFRRENPRTNIELMSKLAKERQYANSSIVGIFKALELIDIKTQKLPDLLVTNDIEEWKIIFLSLGEYILKIDLDKNNIKESNVSYFNATSKQIDFINQMDKNFKNTQFKKAFGYEYEKIQNTLQIIKDALNYQQFAPEGSIANFISFKKDIEGKLAKLDIPLEYLDYLTLDLGEEKIDGFRPGAVKNNAIMKPIIKKDAHLFVSPILIEYSSESYYQIFNTWSFPFGAYVDDKIKNEIAQEYSQFYSKIMCNTVAKISSDKEFQIRQEIMSKEWNTLNKCDLGDIDALMWSVDFKIVFINEIKYKKKHFYNLNSKYKAESKWIKRQNEREQALRKYCFANFPGFDCYVNIITIDAITFNARVHYFNNITIHALPHVLENLKKSGGVPSLKKL